MELDPPGPRPPARMSRYPSLRLRFGLWSLPPVVPWEVISLQSSRAFTFPPAPTRSPSRSKGPVSTAAIFLHQESQLLARSALPAIQGPPCSYFWLPSGVLVATCPTSLAFSHPDRHQGIQIPQCPSGRPWTAGPSGSRSSLILRASYHRSVGTQKHLGAPGAQTHWICRQLWRLCCLGARSASMPPGLIAALARILSVLKSAAPPPPRLVPTDCFLVRRWQKSPLY